MTVDVVLAMVGTLGLLVAALSSRIRHLPLSEPALALVMGIVAGPLGAGWLDVPTLTTNNATMHEASRLLLAVSVMAVALRYPVSEVIRTWKPVALLLLVAMPGMAAISAALAWAVLGLPLAGAVLFGAAVAPTDPVLASSVVTGDTAEAQVPGRTRQILSLESGANDGLALPLVLAALALAGPISAGMTALETAWQLAGATILGVGTGWMAARALGAGERHGASEPGPVLFFTLVLALAVLGASGLLKVDGVLAVFVSGLAFNAAGTGRERTVEVPIDEAVNRFAVVPLFLLLGALLPWREWAALGWAVTAGLAVAVLVLRRLPLILLLRRPLGLPTADAVYLGWFGPVGVSALFYLTMEADRLGAPAVSDVLVAGSLVVAVSTLVHGLTSAPGRALYHRAVATSRAGYRQPADRGT